MNRIGIIVALAVGVFTGVLFALFPELDLTLAAAFFDPSTRSFAAERLELLGLHLAAPARDASMWIVAALALPAAVAPLLRLLLPGWQPAIAPRASVFLLLTLALAPGLLTNVLLKEHWGRPRPAEVVQFAGPHQFMPWWDPRGQCPRNCSFVTGEGAGAFWTLAPAALSPLAIRPLAYAAAIAFGTAVGALRMAYGGHFFTDVVSSGVLTFVIIWLVHGILY